MVITFRVILTTNVLIEILCAPTSWLFKSILPQKIQLVLKVFVLQPLMTISFFSLIRFIWWQSISSIISVIQNTELYPWMDEKLLWHTLLHRLYTYFSSYKIPRLIWFLYVEALVKKKTTVTSTFYETRELQRDTHCTYQVKNEICLPLGSTLYPKHA